MKIAINGEIVDTETIYKIGKIEGDKYFIGEEGREHSTYTFDIHFFNQKKLRVHYSGSDLFGDGWHCVDQKYFEIHPRYKARIDAVLRDITKFRDLIIQVWSNNQGTIPKFNLMKIDEKLD